MKSFLFLCALVAVCAGGAVREKRGWSSGWDGGLVSTGSGWHGGLVSAGSGWSGGWGGYAPSQKLVAVNKVVNVQREVSVPKLVHVRKIISEPRVVTVKKLVPAAPYYGHAPVYSPGWTAPAGWW